MGAFTTTTNATTTSTTTTTTTTTTNSTQLAGASDTNLPEDVLPNQLSNVARELATRRNDLWRSNYHEASIYIEEGLNNDKFENHPRKRASKLVPASNRNQSFNSPHQLNTTDQISGQTGQNQQASPLLVCIEDDKLHQQQQQQQQQQQHYESTTFKLDDTVDKDQRKGGGGGDSEPDGARGGATFLLGGQYTTIETYILVHNRYFYQLDLAASIVLLMLALVEPPAVDGYELNPTIHAAIEMFALGIIAIELLLKFRWMGPRRFFSHGRTVAKLLVLLTMNLEAIVIFFRHSIHARYSRALRPIFLIDNHYCHGLRRAVRQIFQSLPPVIDMFTLVLFFMFVFSIFGFYLLAASNPYFSDIPSTVGNLLVLATTANLPDIMMPSYAVSRWSAVYFVLFIIIHLFLFTNLTMAAVYEIFTRKEKEKFHKLLLHRRKACQNAFKLLVSRRQPNRIQYRQFMGLMRYLNQKCSMFDAYLIFKALDTDQSGCISLEEFYQIYDFINLEWKLIYPEFKWYDSCHSCLPKGCKLFLSFSERIVRHRAFEWTIDILIAVQAFLQFVEASTFKLASQAATTAGNTVSGHAIGPAPAAFNLGMPQVAGPLNQTVLLSANGTQLDLADEPVSYYIKPDKISTFVFISVFLVEMLIRCSALGWRQYWHSRWNRFDLIVLIISIGGLISGSVGGQPFGWVIVLRILRLMRVFEYKRRYKDMWQTLTYILLKHFVSMTCVVMILYYFFAIIGMELFGDYDLRNCCQNTSLEAQFKFDNSTESVKYYLNDFGDIVSSYLTLFSMSSSTYWLTTMSAYAIVSGSDWTRVFFALYYLGSIIVMNIVIAFILESFLFHIHYRNKMGDNCDDSSLFTVTVTLSSFEVDFLRKNLKSAKDTRKLDDIVETMQANQQHKDTKAYFEQDNFDDETATLLGHNNTNSSGRGKSLNNLKNARTKTGRQYSTTTSTTRRNAGGVKFSQKTPFGGAKFVDKEPTETCLQTPKVGMARQTVALNGKRGLSRDDGPTLCVPCYGGGNSTASDDSDCQHRRPDWYLIYQAEQIRNKFSFTMKMYADEVGAWLAEADQDDQDEMSLMISRNQIRAEHVAMARLARRNLAEMQAAAMRSDDGHLPEWSRPRSWSTSGGARGGAALWRAAADGDGGTSHEPDTSDSQAAAPASAAAAAEEATASKSSGTNK